MLKVKVRFTGKKDDIDKVISFMTEFMDEDFLYKVLTLSDISAFYPNRGSTEDGRVYCDFNYDPDIYHYED